MRAIKREAICTTGFGQKLMKLLSEKKARARLEVLISDFKSQISNGYEHRAKSCLTCDVKGSCCLDAHFVNVHISRLEAVNIGRIIAKLPEVKQQSVYRRIEEAIEMYDLGAGEDTYSQTYACPLFEKGTGCIVHNEGKPAACTIHACYENAVDLPPDELQVAQERKIDDLNARTYGRRDQWLPIPLALTKY